MAALLEQHWEGQGAVEQEGVFPTRGALCCVGGSAGGLGMPSSMDLPCRASSWGCQWRARLHFGAAEFPWQLPYNPPGCVYFIGSPLEL